MGADAVVMPGPRTTTLQMYPAISGHLMIPISEFEAKSAGKKSRLAMMATGDVEEEALKAKKHEKWQ
jgi:hypothetical protein